MWLLLFQGPPLSIRVEPTNPGVVAALIRLITEHFVLMPRVVPSVCPARITKLLIEQDGPGWRENLPEIPVVPLSVQQQHRDRPVSAEVAQARAARAAQEEGR